MQPYYSDPLVTLYCADCTGFADWRVANSSLVTDPPYGIAYKSGQVRVAGRARGIVGDEDTSLRDAVLDIFYEADRALIFGSWKKERPAATRMVLY